MARKKAKPSDRIIFNAGSATLECERLYAEYESVPWLFRVNPRLLFPGLRKDLERTIYVNGKKYGVGFHTDACIPLPGHLDDRPGVLPLVTNYLRITLGLFSPKHHRGYYYLKLGRYKFVVLSNTNDEGCIYGTVYQYLSGEAIGTFVFDSDFDKVIIRDTDNGLPNTLRVVVGYIADTNIYNSVIKYLTKTVEVVDNSVENTRRSKHGM